MHFEEIENLAYVDIADKVIANIDKELLYTLPFDLSNDDRTDYEATRLYKLDEQGNEVDFDHPEFSVIKDLITAVKNQLKNEKIKASLKSVMKSNNFAKAMLNLGLFNPQDRVVVPNVLMKFCEEDDTVTIESILVESKRLDDIDFAIETEEALVQYGVKVEEVCKNTIRYITGLNKSLELTGPQIDQLQTDFEVVENWLRRARPGKAYSLLSGMQPTEVATQEVIDKVKLFLVNKLSEL